MKKFNKGFTLFELVVVICIIAILSAIIVPTIIQTYNGQVENIKSIYNGSDVICYYNNEIIYQGKSDDIPEYFKDIYILDDVKYSSGIVYMYYVDKIVKDTIPEITGG